MRDTFKKLGKDAITTAKAEVSNGVTSVKNESGAIASSVTEKSTSLANGTGIGEKFVKKAIGAGDLLAFKNITESNSYLNNFINDGEKVYYYLESVEDEIAITNYGIITSNKKNIASSKTTLTRSDYKHNIISNLHIETAGTIDLDAELKFTIGEEKQSWDIQKSQINQLFELYRGLHNVSKTQIIYEQKIDSLNTALTVAATGVKVSTNENTVDQFKAIVEYSESRLNDMLVYDYSKSFEE